MPIKNAFTVDLEEWFHISGVPSLQDMKRWDDFESRIEDNTHRLLKILDDHDVKATFFVLGWIAEKYPELVKEIYDKGHEIGNHGYKHELINDMTSKTFEKDLLKSEQLIEEVIGEQITIHRAPSFSIGKDSIWTFEVLAKNGYKIDSSIFKGKRDCGGTCHPKLFKDYIFGLETNHGEVIEFPLRKEKIFGIELPVTGGGYLRTLPRFILDKTIKKANEKGIPIYLYIHPSDLDRNRPVPKDIRFSKRIRAKIGLGSTERKLKHLMEKYEFAPIGDVIEETEILDYETI